MRRAERLQRSCRGCGPPATLRYSHDPHAGDTEGGQGDGQDHPGGHLGAEARPQGGARLHGHHRGGASEGSQARRAQSRAPSLRAPFSSVGWSAVLQASEELGLALAKTPLPREPRRSKPGMGRSDPAPRVGPGLEERWVGGAEGERCFRGLNRVCERPYIKTSPTEG